MQSHTQICEQQPTNDRFICHTKECIYMRTIIRIFLLYKTHLHRHICVYSRTHMHAETRRESCLTSAVRGFGRLNTTTKKYCKEHLQRSNVLFSRFSDFVVFKFSLIPWYKKSAWFQPVVCVVHEPGPNTIFYHVVSVPKHIFFVLVLMAWRVKSEIPRGNIFSFPPKR